VNGKFARRANLPQGDGQALDPPRPTYTEIFGKDVGRHDVLSRRNQFCCAWNAVPQAIGSVTRVSSRVEFIESEFNGTSARSPYIQYQVSASDAASR
jgi:hypothetical protein